MHKLKILPLPFVIFICTNIFSQYDCSTSINYGSNSNGEFVEVNEIRLHYETYGDSTKQTLLLIHGNGGSIRSGRCQIEYFKNDYFVIAVDSRLHGKSEFGSQELSYELMAKDYESFLECLNINSVYILGHSDGGIIGLLLAMNNPDLVKKLITIAPNLKPDNSAIHQWDIDRVSRKLEETKIKIQKGEKTSENIKTVQRMNLMDKFPNIDMKELSQIKSPVLVIAGDEDVIRLEHILEIYQNIPKAQLFIMPGATHLMIRHEHELLNQISNKFLSNPFKRPTTKKLLIKE